MTAIIAAYLPACEWPATRTVAANTKMISTRILFCFFWYDNDKSYHLVVDADADDEAGLLDASSSGFVWLVIDSV